MSRVCPQCHGFFDEHLQCPTCGVRLFSTAVSRAAAPAPALPADGEPWQHTALGRLLVGLILAQGLAYALRTLCQAALLVTGAGEPGSLWTTMTGLAFLQALQGVGLLIGGALAAAGQSRGALLGSAVGLVNGFVSVIVQHLSGDQVTEVLLYGQPVLHLAFGTLGGLAGTLLWKPLPALTLARTPGEGKGERRRARPHPVLSAPINWVWALLGTTLALVGVFWPKVILEVVLNASQGRMSLSSHLQAQLVTWEVSGLIVFFGACVGGTNAVSGLKQGLCVGIMAGLFFLGIRLATGQLPGLEQTVFTVLAVFFLSAAGGWFGGRLFPPLAVGGRKGLVRVSLARLEG
jgi:hypothetical protein